MRTGVVAAASLTGALALSGAVLTWGTADQVSGGDPVNAATALVPRDGLRVLAEDDGSLTVTEHARLTGPEMVVTSPPLVGGALAETLPGDPFGWRIWRSTTTTYDQTDDASGEQVTTLRRLTDDGLEQIATYGPFPIVFDPPLLEVPADVGDGSRWSGKGLAFPEGDIAYAGDFTADDDGEGCLRITGSLVLSRNGETLLDSPTDERWCAGRGLVPDEQPDDGVAPFDASTDPLAARAVDVGDWAEHPRPLLLANSVETAADTGAVASAVVDVGPGGVGDDRLVVASGQGRDVWGLVRSDESLVRQWVAHPGGTVTSLATSGDLTLVGTSRRQVVAYGPQGEWRWTHSLDDVPVTAPFPVDEDVVIVTSAAGEVDALDTRTGEVLWDAALTDRVGIPPVTDGDVVVVADEAGRLAAYDVSDGEERWSTDVVDALAIAVVDEQVVVHTGGSAQAYALRDGGRLWSSRLTTTIGSATVADLGRTVVVASDGDTYGLDADTGEQRWREDGAEVSLGVDRTLVQLTGDHVLLARDADGAELGRWRLSELTGTVAYLTFSAYGVWVSDGTGTTVEVGQ